MAGPRAVVMGPPLIPPAHSILTSVAIAPPAESADLRWGNGLIFQPESCGGDVLIFEVCDDTPTEKNTGERPDAETFEPFVVSATVTCSTIGMVWADEVAKARRKLDACAPKQIEKELWTAALIAENPRFEDSVIADDLGAGLPATVSDGLACLEQYIADCACGGGGIVHVTRKVASKLSSLGLIFAQPGGKLVTELGTIVVAGTGYPGTNPSGAVPSASAQNMYATTMVKIWNGPTEIYPREEDVQGATDRSANTVEVRAERLYAAVFDPCCLGTITVQSPNCGASGS